MTKPLTRNITALFRTATPSEIEAGADWYRDAHEIAVSMAHNYCTTVEVSAGVLAALSPLQSWGANVNLAHRFLAAGGLDAGYLKANLKKARQILAGAPIEATLSGLKVTNFYRSVITEGAEGICIDRHAWRVVTGAKSIAGDIPSLSPKRYAEAAECYTRAARILGRETGLDLSPGQVQSVTWTLWRRRWWSVGAWD